MKFKEYFLHTLAVGFFAAAVTYKSWLLGICSVMISIVFTAAELYRSFLQSKQNDETVKSLKQITADQEKMQQKLDQWQSELGNVSYRVNQMSDYVGSPRN